mgnify:FL=1|tara:strand:- start:1641 stop:2891 length:1251 start_codon:yes stop_codon:yes gene_type:complete
MRTLKRPMFRKGGNVGTGIMTGIVDRTEAANGFLPGSTAEMKGAMGSTAEGIDLAYPLPKVSEYKPMVYENIDIDSLVSEPKTQAEYIKELREGAGEYGGMDPLTSFLLTAGPNVAKATSFADAVSRLQPATQQLIKSADAKAKFNRDLRMAATKLALGAEEKAEDKRFQLNLKDLDQENQVKFLNDQRAYARLEKQDKRDYDEAVAAKARAYQKMDEQEKRNYEQDLINQGRAFELEKIKRAEKFEMDKLESQQKFQKELYDLEKEDAKKYTEKDFLEVYEGDTLQAKNRAEFENDKLKTKILEKFGSQFEGFLNGPNDPQESTMTKKGNNKKVGKVYYDVNTGEVKIYNKKTDGTYGFQVIDIDTYTKPEPPKGSTKEEKDAEIDERYEYLSDDQRKILEEIQKNKPDAFDEGI